MTTPGRIVKSNHELNTETVRKALLRLENYRIPRANIVFTGETLGSGGFGIVKQAKLFDDTGKSRLVAVKDVQCDQNAIPLRVAYRLAREMITWSQCIHENVVPFLGYYLGDDFEPAYLLSPYMENGNLGSYLKKTSIDGPERLYFVKDTISGLEYLHSRNPKIVHADLKAANVLVTPNRTAQLCDFGLAKAIQESSTGLTTSTGFSGSEAWSSPEVMSDLPPSVASDIWSWACLVLEIMTDERPFPGLSTNGIIGVLVKGGTPEPQSLPTYFPQELLALLRACWQTNPSSRPPADYCRGIVERVTTA